MSSHGWTPVADELVEQVGLIPALIYGRVWRYCQGANGQCWASVRTIGESTGVSKSVVADALHVLCEAGYIEKMAPGSPRESATYHVTTLFPMVARMTGNDSDGESVHHTDRSVRHTDAASTTRTEASATRTEETTKIQTRNNEETVGAEPSAPLPWDLPPEKPKRRNLKVRAGPAVNLHWERMGVRLNSDQIAAVNAAVVTDADMTRWGVVLTEWRMRGWSPVNVKGMLDMFRGGQHGRGVAFGRPIAAATGPGTFADLAERYNPGG